MEELNTKQVKRPIKVAGYKSNRLNARIEQRSNDAIKRNIKYQSLTVNEKLANIASRRGSSKKELTRLLAFKEATKVATKETKVAAAPAAPVESTESTEAKPKVRKPRAKSKVSPHRVKKANN
jgi:hypothetical protein